MNVNPRDRNNTNINASIYYSNPFIDLVYINGCKLVFIYDYYYSLFLFIKSLDIKFYAIYGENTAVLLNKILNLYLSSSF